MKFRFLFIIFIFGLYTSISFHSQNCTWNGSIDGDWHTIGNWTTSDLGAVIASRVPTSSDSVIIISSVNDPIIGAAAEAGTLTINSGGLLEISGVNFLNVAGTVTINGTLTLNTFIGGIECGSDWDDTGGSFILNGFDKVIFDGSGSHTINTNSNFIMLEINSGTYKASSNFSVQSLLSISGGAILDPDVNTITIDPGTSFTNNGNLVFSNSSGIFDVNGTATFTNSGTIDMTAGGTLKLSLESPDIGGTGTFTSGTGTVEYDRGNLSFPSGNQTIDEVTYNNLTINGTDDTDVKTASGTTLDVNGNLTITNGKLDMNTNTVTLDLEGDFSMAAAGAFDAGTSTTHTVGGSWADIVGSTFTPNNGKFTFEAAAGNTTITTNASFYDLSIQTLGNSVSAAADLTVNNDFTMTAGNTGNFSAAAALTVNNDFTMTAGNTGNFSTGTNTVEVTGATNINGGILEIADSPGIFDAKDFDANGAFVTFTGNGTLKLGGNAGSTPDLGTFDATTNNGTVEYDLDGNQGVFNATYHHLEIDNSTGTATAASALGVEGNLTITNGNLTLDNIALTLGGNFVLTSGTFVPGNGDHTVTGNWTETLGGVTTFEATAGKFTFNGAGSTIISDADNGNKFFNLTSAGNPVTAGSNLDIDGDLEVTTGTMDMAGYDANVAKKTDVDGTLLIRSGQFDSPLPFGQTLIGALGTVSIDGGTYIANVINSAGTLEFLGVGGTLEIIGSTPIISGVFTAGSGKVLYSRAFGTQDILGLNYYDLEIAGVNSGVGIPKDATGNITVQNSLKILETGTTGPTFNMQTFDLSVTGNFLMSNGTFNGGSGNSHTITGNFILEAGNFNAESNFYVIVGDLTLNGGTYSASSSTLDLAGNWDDVNGTFQPSGSSITMSGVATKTINTGNNNKFNNLIVSGTVSTNSDFAVEIGGALTVSASGTLTVAAGDTLSFSGVLNDAHTVANTGTLTLSTTAALNSTLDFRKSTLNTLEVNGTLNLNGVGNGGDNSVGRAIVIGDDNSRVDISLPSGANTGTFNGSFFTVRFPVSAGLQINSDENHSMRNGAFYEPFGGGALLNFEDADNLPQTIDSCSFNGANGVDINVKGNAQTSILGFGTGVTFINYGGSLALNATDAEDNDDDSGDPGEIMWFNNKWYSFRFSLSKNVNEVAAWYSDNNPATIGSAFNPTDFNDENAEFIIDDQNTPYVYQASSNWSPAGKLTILGNSATLDPKGFTITLENTVDIATGGILSFSDPTGIVDVDGTSTFTNSGTIDMTAGGTLKLSLESPDIGGTGTFTSGTGTVEYDRGNLSFPSGNQTIDEVTYNNLTINGTDDTDVKTASGTTLDVNGNLTITNGKLDMNTNTVTLDLEGDFSMAAAGAFDAGTSTTHTVGGSWADIVGSTFTPNNGKFTFEAAAGNTTITTNASFYDLSIQTLGNSVSAAADLTVNNDFTMTAGNTGNFSAAAALTVNNDFTMTAGNTGNFSTGTNTVEVTGATNINGGILEIADSPGIFDAKDFDANGAFVTFTGNGTLKLGGNAGSTPDLGTFDATTNNGTVEYDLDGNQGVFNATYHHLEIDNSTGTATAASALGVEGNLTITNGNLTLDNIALTLGGNFVLTSGTFVPGNGDHTVTGNWTETLGGVTTFEATAGKFTFNGAGSTIISDADNGNKFFNLTSAGNPVTAGYNLDIDGDFTITGGPFVPGNFNHTVAGNWDDSGGIFTAGAGTGKITFDGGTSTNIKSGLTNDFHHFEINTTADKTVITNNLDIDGDFTIILGTFNPGAFSHDIAGNWDDSGGSFTGGTGTVTMSASNSAIKAGKDNKFNNLIVSGTDTINSDFAVEIGGDLTVSGTLTVVPGDTLSFSGTGSTHTIDGNLTVNTSSAVNSILDFTGSTNNTVVVDNGGILTLDGTDATGRAYLIGDAVSEIDLTFPDDISGSNNGKFVGDHFTISYPVAAGIKINSDAAHEIEYGVFKNPTSGGVLLNFESAGNLPQTIDSCSFIGFAGNDTNVRANASTFYNGTDPVTFINYGGSLAPNATDAELYDEDPNDQVTWFSNKYYSDAITESNPSINTAWFSEIGGTGFNPSATDFATNSNIEYIMINFDELTATSDWTNPGTLTLNTNSKIDPGDFTINSANTTITEFAILRFTAGNGTFEVDAGGTFVNEGNISDMTVGDTLKIALASPDLAINTGVFTAATGTVVYDGAVQNIDNENYHHLTISAAGAKTAGQDLVVAGDLNVSAGDLVIGNNSLTLTGNFSMSGGSFTAGNNTGHTVGGSWTETGGVFTPGAAGKFTFEAAAGNTTITTLASFYDLSISTGGNSVSAAAALTVDNDFTMTAGNSGNFSAAAALNVTGAFTMDALNTGNFITGSNTVTVTGATNIDADTLMISTGGIFDADGDFNANGAFVTFTGDGTLKLGGNSGGTPDLGTLNDGLGGNITRGTVVYDNQAGGQTIYDADEQGTGYFNLIIDNDLQTATYQDGNDPLVVLGDLTITTGKLKSDGFPDYLDLEGDFLMNGGEFDPGNSIAHTVAGNWTENGGLFQPTAGKITFDGTGTSIIITFAGNNFWGLNINSSGNLSCQAQTDITISDLLRISDTDTLDMAGNDGSAGSVENTGTLKMATGEFTTSGTTTFGGAAPFGTLSIGTGTYNADGQFTAGDNGEGEVIFTGDGNLVCSSTSNNTFGTLTDDLGTVTKGTVTFDATLGPQVLPEETFNNLTVNNASHLTMSTDVTVNGDLDLTIGNVVTNDNVLTIGTIGTISNATDASHVNVSNDDGYLSKIFGSASPFSFPVGNGFILRPIELTTTDASTFNVRYDSLKFLKDDNPANNLLNVSSALGSGFGANGHVSGYANKNSTADPLDLASGYAQDSPAIPVDKGYHYNIVRSSGTAGARLKINWTNQNQYGTGGPGIPGDVADVDLITWAEWNGASWDTISSSPTGSIHSGSVVGIGANFNNSTFTLGSIDESNYLPIDLVSFDGECIDNKTNLEFVVASQVNNDYFTIKRSNNNLEWEEVGFINGGATNNEEITYTWIDNSPKSGVNYYKLFQTDIDGVSKSFSPIAINCESNVDDYHIYPNPTNDIVSVEFDLEYYQGDDIQAVLKDFKGVIVKSNPIELKRGYNYFEVDLRNIPSGFYVLSYSGTKNHIPSKRIVKL